MLSSVARLLIALLFLQPLAAQYRAALPGYRYVFPRDHFSHPEFQTEWWYYTGNLKATDGHRFGFELTFFRHGVARDVPKNAAKSSAWDVHDVYFAHLALSDLDSGKFYPTARTNRTGPGIAGISESSGRIWNGNWQIKWKNNDQELQAIAEQFQLYFLMRSEKEPIIHGENGVSQKADAPGRASHYISLTRLTTTGSIELFGQKRAVSGLAWMDHEFFTNQLGAEQTGWDWLSLQLENKTELMLFRIRRKNGSIDRFSAGTFVDPQGKPTHLKATQFTLEPLGETWKSKATNAVYPIRWKIAIPGLGIELEAKTLLASQELTSNTRFVPNYWEGAILLTGKERSHSLHGAGYLEMTGYDRPDGALAISRHYLNSGTEGVSERQVTPGIASR
ncbi:MAG TPA: lipocalin-like domain-containing protein [Candidatus Dormibacteraeota bacterium]|nr:lipocalin-like domain-containing protein [Candidatus Dormibacteraeota bacterium]